jgi:hypothetical protein
LLRLSDVNRKGWNNVKSLGISLNCVRFCISPPKLFQSRGVGN